MNQLFEVCGEENFNQLNELFHVFKDKWPEFKIITLFKDLKNQVNNENTKIFYQIIDKRDEILANMLEFKKQNTNRR